MTVQLYLGECLSIMKALQDNSVDSIVTDPPYGLSFMNKKWDYDVPSVEIWAECLRVLKPGGHLLAFAGTRTQHRMAVNIEDAGFEIRDMIAWVYGSGFPKSMDVSKAIDKARDDSADILRVTIFMADAAARAGVTRADVDAHMGTSDMGGWWLSRLQHRCQCPKWGQWLQLKALLNLGDEMDAEVWRLNGRKGTPGEAWQTAEVLAVDVRMNEASGIVSAGRDARVEVERQIKAANSDAARQWQGWGTALKPALEPITMARKPLNGTVAANVRAHGTGALNVAGCRVGGEDGRWPANLIHDGSDEVRAAFPEAKGQQGALTENEPSGKMDRRHEAVPRIESDKSAARFFYCAKASRKDRHEGLQDPGPQFQHGATLCKVENMATTGNNHPTVKPTDLMTYLCRLVTPPGGVVLDPFMGSGSTGKAALRERFQFIGIEMDQEYFRIAELRIKSAKNHQQNPTESKEAQLTLFSEGAA